MLVLSRRVGESIIIADNIRVMVLEIRWDRIRLAFEAPKEVKIFKEEIWLKIQQGEKPPSSAEPTDPDPDQQV
jgi:carbon storage regulator